MSEKTPLALCLISGGLDSVLACKIMMDQGIRTEAIAFVTPWFGAEDGKKAAESLGIVFHEVDISKDHWEKVRKPKWGWGGGANPCIDCHALMVKKALDWLAEKGEEKGFVVTGEVLGQRPMSQNKGALGLVKKGGGEVLRPLSALLLEETEMEKKGWVKRGELLDITGRGRERQLELAEKWGIKVFKSAGGGCALTEKEIGMRVKELFKRWPEVDFETGALVRMGRILWFEKGMGVIGRNQEENGKLEEMKREGDVILRMKEIPGPIGLLRNWGEISEGDLEEMKEKIKSCSRKGREAQKVEWELMRS